MRPRALRTWTITYSNAELVTVFLIGAVVAAWAAVAAGSFSLRVFLASELMFFAFYLVGSLFAAVPALAAGIPFDLPLRLLIGYGVSSTALLVLAWLSPLGIVLNGGVLLLLAVGLFFGAGERRRGRGDSASLWAIAICLLATTLWCQDSIRPTLDRGDTLVVKPWVDGFYHAVHIRIFAASHGAASIEDFRMAGVPARPYHYGIYMLPALIKQLSEIHSFAAFAGVLAPVGVLFSGLSAYAFFGSLWGAWPGLTAASALLLLPDGAQQGMGNPFMSYHFLTQISPSATYGLALLGVAWLFVFAGCKRGSAPQLIMGWSAAALVLAFKLHYVVASALLLLIVPAVFWRGRLGVGRRALWIISACVVYAAALLLGQKVPGVPLIRFDGSSAGEILRLVQSFALPGPVQRFAAQHLGPQFPLASNLLFGIPYVLLAALGVFAPLLVVLAVRARRRLPRLEVLFPILLIVNFLVMFFGLALDFDSSTPDELSHRPVMIVYFFVVAWIGGALGSMLGESSRLRTLARPLALGVAAVLLVVPAMLGSGVQLLPAMPQISPVRLPKPLVHLAEYIRAHGGPEDVFQDSRFDRTYTIAALAERRAFVAHTLTRMPFRAEMVDARSEAIDRFMGIVQPKLVLATARAFGFRWFVLERGDRVDWPAELADHPVFEEGAFRLYRFGP